MQPGTKKAIKIILFLLPLGIAAKMLFVKIYYPALYVSLIEEDNLVENLQALFYLGAAAFAFLSALVLHKKKIKPFSYLYFILAAGFFLVCMEEISWGQRIFGVETPQYFQENNYQKEISIHNISMFQKLLTDAYIVVGLLGMFSWVMIPASFKNKYKEKVWLIVPSPITALYFLPVFLFYLYRGYLQKHVQDSFIIPRDQEPAELILTLGFLMFTLLNYYRLKFIKHGSN